MKILFSKTKLNRMKFMKKTNFYKVLEKYYLLNFVKMCRPRVFL